MKMFYSCENGIYTSSKRGHTVVASYTRMSERQYLWGIGSKAQQIVENVFNYFPREHTGDTTAAVQQTVHATGVGLNAVYKIRCEAKSTGGLFTFYF